LRLDPVPIYLFLFPSSAGQHLGAASASDEEAAMARMRAASGASIDSQDTLAFSALSGVRPMIETMPLVRAAEAYARMMRGAASDGADVRLAQCGKRCRW
jgi:hypothetical protein